jgi:hypothetical protein
MPGQMSSVPPMLSRSISFFTTSAATMLTAWAQVALRLELLEAELPEGEEHVDGRDPPRPEPPRAVSA